MAILVTGMAGYIGSHTVVELLNEGYEVVGLDNFSNSKPAILDRIRQITGKDFTFYQADINDGQALEDIFTQHEIETVIHFAAYKAVGESVDKPLKYYDNNIGGTVNLLKVMDKMNVKHIIYSSSATVYGMDNQVPFKETDFAEIATNPYGYTKIVTEQLLMDLCQADSEWSATILRYFNPIGAHESGTIGEDPQGIPNNLMPYITQVAVGKRDHLSIFGDDYETKDGTGVRDYIHVVDLAKGHVKSVDYTTKHTGANIFNLGNGLGYSVLELVNTFKEVNGVDIPYEITPRRSGDVAESFADVSKAHQELGWQAEKNLEEMCRDSWNWQTNNPNGFE